MRGVIVGPVAPKNHAGTRLVARDCSSLPKYQPNGTGRDTFQDLRAVANPTAEEGAGFRLRDYEPLSEGLRYLGMDGILLFW